MNECLLALCLALGAPDGRLAVPLSAEINPPHVVASPRTWTTNVESATSLDTVPRPRDPVFGEDKWKHFFTSFVITSLGATGARAAGLERDWSLGVGAGLSLSAGAAKEYADFRNPARGHPSALDLVWDVLGTGAGVVVAAQAYDR